MYRGKLHHPYPNTQNPSHFYQISIHSEFNLSYATKRPQSATNLYHT